MKSQLGGGGGRGAMGAHDVNGGACPPPHTPIVTPLSQSRVLGECLIVRLVDAIGERFA